jgi:hypothetical protein
MPSVLKPVTISKGELQMLSKRGSRGRRMRAALVGLATVVATFAAGHVAHADGGTWTDPSGDATNGGNLDITNVAVSNDASDVTYDITFASLDVTKVGRVAIQYDWNGDGAIDSCLDVVQSTYAASGLQGTITDRCSGGTVGSVAGPPVIPALPDAGTGGLVGTATVTIPSAGLMRVVLPLSTLRAAGESGNSYGFRVGADDTTSPALFVEDDYAPDVPGATGEVDFYTDQLSGVTTLPSLSIGNAKRALSSGSAKMTFVVKLSAASTKTVTVAYQTHNGTAVSPKDYTATSGTLTFNPGDLSKSIVVTVRHGKKGSHTFTVSLSNAINAGFSNTTGTGTIVDG